MAREFGWTPDEMRRLVLRELTAILDELQRQKLIEEYNEQRNRWNFLAAVITNGVSVLSSTIAGAFGGRRRKPKLVQPDDFVSKDAKKLIQGLLNHSPEIKSSQEDWEKHIKDAQDKGLRGPWYNDAGGEKAC